MITSRRRFIQTSALASAGVAIAGRRVFGQSGLLPYKGLPNLRKFIAPLPGLGPAGIPVAAPNKSLYPGTDYYRIVLGQYRQQMHPDIPTGTKLWGYADATVGVPKFRYLGPAIVGTAGRPARIMFVNQLPRVHPLPVDNTLPGAETSQAVNRAAVHLHGGFVPWHSDGGPFHWFAPNGTRGPSVVKWLPDRTGRMTDDYWYPNAQTARLMWYHDHAVGLTRLNAYAGLAAPYVIVDAVELAMFGATGSLLPGQLPGIPLVLQDKSFKAVADAFGNVGDLDYPSDYGDQEEHPEGGAFLGLPPVSAVPEFFSDNIVINGMAFPYLELPAGAHRFRMLNGTQSRVFNLQLYREDTANPGEVPGSFDGAGVFVPESTAKGPDFVVIATEGGFLPQAAVVPSNGAFDLVKYYAHDPTGYGLVLAGAERADVLIDFSGAQVGDTFILYNDAGSPFPDGGDRGLDYYAGNPDLTGGPAGYGPNTRTMMKIKIVGGAGQPMPSLSSINTALAAATPGLGLAILPGLIGTSYDPAGLLPAPVNGNFVHRNKTLSEGIDPYRPLDCHARHRRRHRLQLHEARHQLPPGHRPRPGELRGRGHRGVGHLQHHGRHAPDSLPPGQRPDHRPGELRNQHGWHADLRRGAGDRLGTPRSGRARVQGDRAHGPGSGHPGRHENRTAARPGGQGQRGRHPRPGAAEPAHRRLRVRVALPHPRARRARHDAAVHGQGGSGQAAAVERSPMTNQPGPRGRYAPAGPFFR